MPNSAALLNGPVPGQSLTMEPKNAPWEKPPKITDPEKAIEAHLQRLSDGKTIDSIIKLLELGFPVKSMVESILTNAVMNGVHSVDVSLIIAPVIHDYIVSIAKDAGIKFVSGLDESPKEDDREQISALIGKSLEKKAGGDTEPQEGAPQPSDPNSPVGGEPPSETGPTAAPEGSQRAPAGLMTRPDTKSPDMPPSGRGLMSRPTKGMM